MKTCIEKKCIIISDEDDASEKVFQPSVLDGEVVINDPMIVNVEIIDDSSSSDSNNSTSDSEGESDRESPVLRSDAMPGPSKLDQEVEDTLGQEAGPSMIPHYESITPVPTETSTPSHQPVAVFEGLLEETTCMVWDTIQVRAVKKEVKEEMRQIRKIKTDFLKEVKETVKVKAQVYLPKLVEQRSKILTRMGELKKQRKRIDVLLQSLSSQKGDVDSEMDNLNYFVKNFPE